MNSSVLKKKQPWLNALIATTGLSIFFVVAHYLWAAGLQEWAFILAFMAIWTVISISWSNVEFSEESGSILAKIMDHNFQDMSERIEELERELAEITQTSEGFRQQDVESVDQASNSLWTGR